MITLLLHLLRLLPFFFGGHRQLAVENLALRQQLAVYKRTTARPQAAHDGSPLLDLDAFPNDSAPSYLLRDRDQVYGQRFRHRVKGMRIDEVLTAPTARGKIPSRSGSSARCDASASTILSFSASGICDAS